MELGQSLLPTNQEGMHGDFLSALSVNAKKDTPTTVAKNEPGLNRRP
jgi:hypothetical protein